MGVTSCISPRSCLMAPRSRSLSGRSWRASGSGSRCSPQAQGAQHRAGPARRALGLVTRTPYRNAQIRGRAVGRVEYGPEFLELLNRLSVKYIERPTERRTGILYWVEPDTALFQDLTRYYQHPL